MGTSTGTYELPTLTIFPTPNTFHNITNPQVTVTCDHYRSNMSITLEQAQAELSKNDRQLIELQKRNAELQEIIKAQGGVVKSSKKKRSSEGVLKDSTNSNKKAKTVDPEKIATLATSVTRKIQGQISAKLKWKKSFARMKGGATKGARVEVVCQHPEVFEYIFSDATIKTGKDGKLSCTIKDEDEVYSLPFKGKSYQYSSASLQAPCSASFKDGALVFNFKYCID